MDAPRLLHAPAAFGVPVLGAASPDAHGMLHGDAAPVGAAETGHGWESGGMLRKEGVPWREGCHIMRVPS